MGDEPSARVLSALLHLSRMVHASTIAEAEACLLEAFQPFGVSMYAAWIAPNAQQAELGASMITNWPGEWVRSYLEGRRHLHDPVVLRALANPGDFMWHELPEPGSPEGSKLRKEAFLLGMVDGFTVSWRGTWQFATILSLSGGSLAWDAVERQAAAAVADAFLARAMCLQAKGGIPAVQALSPQERRILHLSALGTRDKDIACRLSIHRSTLLTHWHRIRSKLGASDRAQAVALGITSGQIAA